jgi:hypothetical protein
MTKVPQKDEDGFSILLTYFSPKGEEGDHCEQEENQAAGLYLL